MSGCQARSAAVARPREAGSAIIEFVFVAVIVMVPLVYLLVGVSVVQRSQLAVSTAAREVGRAYATSPGEAQSLPRAAAALRLALADQGLAGDATLRFVAAEASCTAAAVTPHLAPGAQFAVCVTRHATLPAVPRVLAGRGVTTVGRYLVHVDEFRAPG